jgi:hypothetical protein
MYLITDESGNPYQSEKLTDEILDCVEAGIFGVFDVSSTPIRSMSPDGSWEIVENYKSLEES